MWKPKYPYKYILLGYPHLTIYPPFVWVGIFEQEQTDSKIFFNFIV